MIHNIKNETLASIGDKGIFVLSLRSMLRRVCPYIYGCPTIEPRGNFDKNVKEAVLAFQKFAGLPQTGVVDYKTWDKLYETAKAIERGYFFEYPGFTLQLGFTGKDVIKLKNMLLKAKKSVPSIRIKSTSELFDTDTELSLIRAQRAFGLIPDGKANRQCWEKLVSQLTC